MRPWCSWLTQPPVTGQTVGSSPIGRAIEKDPVWGLFLWDDEIWEPW